MFHVHAPLSLVEVAARRTVYREYLERHPELKRIPVGAANDMVMLAAEPQTEQASAVLWATGSPKQQVVFPRHRHGKGEFTICLEGDYCETLCAGEVPDDLFGGHLTLADFQARYPGVIELSAADASGTRSVVLHPGAQWSMVSGSEHKPSGYISSGGVLMAQIYWGGHNDITEPNFSPPRT